MSKLGAQRIGALAVLILLIAFGVSAFRTGSMPKSLPASLATLGLTESPLTKGQLGLALADSTSFYHFPSEVDLTLDGAHAPVHAVVEYAFDAKLQDRVQQVFRNYGPDYGAFVALDPKTGRILSMVSYSRNPLIKDNLALRATFPSASVFKVVTAAAAIEEQKFNANTLISFTGQNHTLYRQNVFKTKTNRWTRYSTLKEAFAKSINTVFGRIGAYSLKPEQLRLYADRFGFNRKIASDVPMQGGSALIPSNDPWGVAEAASGYTRDNTMSPLQGALIAASVVNDGTMMEPYLVQAVYHSDGTPMYTAQPTVSAETVDPSTAREIRSLMRETVFNGTCKHAFRGFFKGECSNIDVGGKTGTLNGLNPAGRYDWFVGFAENGGQKIAFASLTIHNRVWRVKSSQIARKAIEAYFAPNMKQRDR
jgi:cell division protein FtsI/penicillin-binding protein 2